MPVIVAVVITFIELSSHAVLHNFVVLRFDLKKKKTKTKKQHQQQYKKKHQTSKQQINE